MPRKYDSNDSRIRILRACIKLFYENGYKSTTMMQIIGMSGIAAGTFQNIFKTKDGVLIDLLKFSYKSNVFSIKQYVEKEIDSMQMYALITAVQLSMVEKNKNIKELFQKMYSTPETLEYIFQKVSSILESTFSVYNPGKDSGYYYELEVGIAGAMNNYISKNCDKYFTIEKKIKMFLTIALNACNVPIEKADELKALVSEVDINQISDNVLKRIVTDFSDGFGVEFSQSNLIT